MSGMNASKIAAILTGTLAAAMAVSFSYIVLGLCLAQPLEDVRPALVPLVNLGAVAILLAIGLVTFRHVFRWMRGN
jgi:hypothetical protein